MRPSSAIEIAGTHNFGTCMRRRFILCYLVSLNISNQFHSFHSSTLVLYAVKYNYCACLADIYAVKWFKYTVNQSNIEMALHRFAYVCVSQCISRSICFDVLESYAFNFSVYHTSTHHYNRSFSFQKIWRKNKFSSLPLSIETFLVRCGNTNHVFVTKNISFCK